MAKVAFVFSGQGDQYPGMGADLAQTSEAAEKIFAVCDEIRPGTSAMCFGGSAEDLGVTSNTQPCLYVMELAAAEALAERGLQADCVAGFSLGEVVAAAFAGYYSVQAGFRLVMRRGELMQACADRVRTSMVAVLKLSSEKVEELAGHFGQVYPVNYNCPGQISVAGQADQMRKFMAEVWENGGRAVPLKVAGAFHSPFMEGAREPFASAIDEELEKSPIGAIPLYSDVTAQPYGENFTELLSSQLCNPVRWEQLVRNMMESGVDTFVEIGPGRTLTNMIHRISVDVKAVSYREMLEENA
ncbi:ACP S-malonyltransferase [Shuttleworthella satelles]|uniref:Malonyl CoA-acyl carrier protein transacylase n=1 Tax=Shuttleworthella satelles DSM 14600 TaxID=626523 RepID=C4G8L7_9FIRM|nr:ACP S-malonyltransferase [Shuttleworthia satelles]EEP28964.1 putative [acyl-carrier-protein] S-malonyltransferase [Shuttleworthia satelles DSM 14600]